MKRALSFLFCIVLTISFSCLDVSAVGNFNFEPCVIDNAVVKESSFETYSENSARVSGLITSYELTLTKTGTTLNIYGTTMCILDVVKCGFKNLTIQRRKSSSYSWEDYYEYGNVYVEAVGANLSTHLDVEKGYQYRISCKHYAKKNLLMVETISNTSNIVTVS